MLRIFVHGLVILHLGPGLAFLALAFGCEGDDALLGSLCGRHEVRSFILITMATWVVLAVLAFAATRLKRSS
jgi:hypothetical protein